MRRLWAHIIIAFTAIVAVFASIPALINRISTNGDYETRRQFTFQLSEREKEDDDDNPKDLTKDSAKEMAKIMEKRLIAYDISSYEITTSANKDIGDVINVTFYADNAENYKNVVTYLTFSGSFAMVNNNDDLVESDLFRRGNAYIKEASVNDYPTIILPVKTDTTEWENLVENATKNPITESSEESSEGEEQESTSYARLYMLYNYQKGDTYQTLTEKSKLEEKTFMQFDFDPSEDNKEREDLYLGSGAKKSLFKKIGFQDTNGNGVADRSEVKAAYDQAEYLLHLFNAEALDYDVECISGLASGTEVWVKSKVEDITTLEGKIAWNSTLTAFIAAFVIITILLVVFYRIGAISAAVTTLVSGFGAFAFMVLAGMEYNALAVVGIVLVSLISLVSNIIYLNKLKEDSYRGHTLKKANTEASKKSLLPIVDIHVVSLLIGLMCYLLGGVALHSFSAILSLGTILSLIINTLGLKGMVWLPTNTTALIGKYEYFGIDSNNVPNHLAEEKQRYFGAYADKDLSSKKKPLGIVSGALFGLSLIGVILSASLSGGSIFKKEVSKVTGNEIYIQNKIIVKDSDSESPLNDNTLYEDILDRIALISYDKDNNEVQTKLSTYVSDFRSFAIEKTETIEDEQITYRTTYYVIKTKSILKKDTLTVIEGEVYPDLTIEEAINDYFTLTELWTSSEENLMSLKDVSSYVTVVNPDWQKITLATVVALLAITLYLLARYRLSRGLASLVFPVAVSGVSLGLIALLSAIGASLPGTVGIVLPVASVVTYLFMILFMNRERELIVDDKVKDDSNEHRAELAKKAMGMSFTPILATAVIGIYLFINFFGFGPASASYLYLFCIVISLFALALVAVLYVPLATLFYKWFSNVKFSARPRENKKNRKQVVKKSAEPEEAIFIGIND